jgi:hypothetical protein
MAAIDPAQFAGISVQNAVYLGVNPHYLVAVAQLRSGIDDGTNGPRIGPYRLLQSEWDPFCTDAEFEYDYLPSDINDWIMQSAIFALMTYRAQTTLLSSLSRYPSALELYAAQWPADPAPSMASFQAALDATVAYIIPATNAVLGQTWMPSPVSTIPDASVPEPTTPDPGPKGQATAPDPATPGGPLGELIARGEGNYNSFNRGTTSSGGSIDFTQMTIAAAMAQQALSQSDPQRLFAVGKYQLIPSTMKSAVANLGLDTGEMLTHAVQEILFREYLVAVKRPAVKSYITNAGGSLASAQMSLALEFASVARPDTGRSNYGGVGGNRASITAAQTAAALQQENAQWSNLKNGGMTADQAWVALSPGIV